MENASQHSVSVENKVKTASNIKNKIKTRFAKRKMSTLTTGIRSAVVAAYEKFK
jgi:hypothetical protein